MIRALLFDFMGVVGYTRMAVTGDPGSGTMQVVMYDEIVDTLKRLRSSGYKLALVSNNDRRHFAQVAPDVFAQLEALFDVVVYSSDVGVDKPHPRIYKFVLEQLHSDADEAHYFDDLARNVDAAINLGMSATVVTRPSDVIEVVEELFSQ